MWGSPIRVWRSATRNRAGNRVLAFVPHIGAARRDQFQIGIGIKGGLRRYPHLRKSLDARFDLGILNEEHQRDEKHGTEGQKGPLHWASPVEFSLQCINGANVSLCTDSVSYTHLTLPTK